MAGSRPAKLAHVMPTMSAAVPFDVLVVDDDHDGRDLLAEYFRRAGLEVVGAEEGRAAIAAIEREPARFGLIVTDLELPGADGLAVLRAARRANPSAYVVIVTGYASLDSAIQAVRLGAYDYLTKPFSLGQIDVIVQRVRDRLTLEAENRRLLRQMAGRAGLEAQGPLTAGLDAIEARLGCLEHLLRELLDRLDTAARPNAPRSPA
jgi:DNA-binding NtrC family response regulator